MTRTAASFVLAMGPIVLLLMAAAFITGGWAGLLTIVAGLVLAVVIIAWIWFAVWVVDR